MIKKLMKELKTTPYEPIYIPEMWNCLNLSGELLPGRLLKVNEPSFLLDTIKSFYKDGEYNNSLSFNESTDWIKKSIAYSMMIRTSTTWDYNNDGVIDKTETGTFIRTIMLIPYLKQMGINLLYLLPISKYSKENMKGELGSVYAVSNFFEFDNSLKSNLSLTIEEEFQCLVEACHMSGIRVVIDIIPRTNSVSSELIKEHPDWFYWIKTDAYDKYGSPKIWEIDGGTPPNDKNMSYVYKSKKALEHLDMFVDNPSSHPDWDLYKHDLSLVREQLGVRVAPAFSDYINDPQPAWTDITFFRLYMDHPVISEKFLTKKYPPYILFDSIKGNLFQGRIKNIELWEKLSDIIPFYQKFGVDGARIDMGHALPKELTEMIITKARNNDKSFVFIAEEMDPSKDESAKEAGYDLILGNGFWMEPRYSEGFTLDFIKGISSLKLPTFACAETHDTQRVAARSQGEKKLARLLTIINMFLPNSVPFINSGQELFEIQPMNLGLDCKDKEDENLPDNDMFYKKLALFDVYRFHYLVENNLIEDLSNASIARNEYLEYVQSGEFDATIRNDVLKLSYSLDKTISLTANFGPKATVVSGEVVFSTFKKDNLLRPGEIKLSI